MGIGTLNHFNPSACELLTESVDETRWWKIVHLIIRFMSSVGITKVNAKFGFVMARDDDGLPQAEDRTLEVAELEQLISEGLAEGTIEMKGPSDFVFESVDHRLIVMLCNDVDIHFASSDKNLVYELGLKIKDLGVKVYDGHREI